MRDMTGRLSELRLVIHLYPKHTTAALVTRDRNGSENWDRRIHAWDLKVLPKAYEGFNAEDTLWVVLGALAAHTHQARRTSRAEPPEPPDGGYRGETLPGL